MTDATRRRTFLKATAAAGAALVLPLRYAQATDAASSAGLRNTWIRIDNHGVVTVLLSRAELGQGIRTAMPMILADELDVDPSTIRLEYAKPGPGYDDLGTGGSDSMRYAWRTLRHAGAAAREMLRGAAALQWAVAADTCRTEAGRVVHPRSGRSLPYGSLVEAASRFPVPEKPAFKAAAERRTVGKATRRIDGPDIVRGAAVYGIDIREPGLKFACLARPPRLGGTLGSFDAAAAKAIPGVRSVVAVSRGVAVVADSTWAALRGVEALEVRWVEGADSNFSSARAWADLEKGAETKGVETRREGDPEGAIASAAKRLDATYHYPLQAHAALEPISYIADVRGDKCRLSGGTQNLIRVRDAVAETLKIAPESVDVGQALVGGGFGRRLRGDYAREAAEISRAVGGPVKLLWTRADDMRHGHFQPASVHSMAATLDAKGQPSLWFHRQASAGHTPPAPTAAEQKDPEFFRDIGWAHHDTPYVFASQLIEYSYVASPVTHGPWRAVFAPPAAFARESFVDEIAHALGKDPLAYRLELLPAGTTMKSGSVSIDRDRLRRVLALAAEKAGWTATLPKAEGGRRHGRGIACNAFHGQTHVAMVAEVSVGASGDVRVHRMVCAVDCGLPINPLGIEGQVESGVTWGLSTVLGGEITYEKGAVQQSTFAEYPVLRLSQAPEVEVHVVQSGDAPFGLGEPPVPPVAPAVCNAVFAATGRRVRRLPLRL